jgi:AcrR family transcriptional regulator
MQMGVSGVRRQRSDGERSRRMIVMAAAKLATTDGLDGLSIGSLATHVGMSKSGLFAHFRSKEELQIATIGAAAAVFDAEVVTPALRKASALEKLTGLCENFLGHVQREVFPGGCFFASAAAEFDTRKGEARDVLAKFQSDWMDSLAALVAEAQADGVVGRHEEAEQLAFELNSMLHLANSTFVLQRSPDAIDRARRGIASRLAVAAPH